MSTEPSVDTSDASAGESGRQSGGFSGGRLATGPLIGLLFALVGGGLGWATLEACDPVFRMPDKYYFEMGPPPELVDEVAEAQNVVHLGNRVFACGLVGAMLAAALGIGEGVARRSLKTILLAAVGCGLVAALFGCAAGVAGHFTCLSRAAVEDRVSVTGTVIIQCALWGPLGAGVGLALGSLAGRLRTAIACLVAGLAAGVLAAGVFPIAASLLLPSSQTDWPVPIGADTRLLWIGCSAVLLGLIVPFAARQNREGRPE